MFVTDLQWPGATEECYPRFLEHRRTLLRGDNRFLGMSLFDGIDVTNISGGFAAYGNMAVEKLKRVGLVLVEQPRSSKGWLEFEQQIIGCLLSQWESATCVLMIRTYEANRLKHSLQSYGRNLPHRLQFIDNITRHYEPCRNGPNYRGFEPSFVGTDSSWTYVIVHPGSNRIPWSEWSIPHMVWENLWLNPTRPITLQCAGFTLESTMEIASHLKRMLRRYNEPLLPRPAA
jgi:hypothetical protein